MSGTGERGHDIVYLLVRRRQGKEDMTWHTF